MCKEKRTIRLNNKEIVLDSCITDLIIQLNTLGIKTKASCCGHGQPRNFYIVIDKNSYTTSEFPFYKPDNDIKLRNGKIPLVLKNERNIDGVLLVDKKAKVFKDGNLYMMDKRIKGVVLCV